MEAFAPQQRHVIVLLDAVTADAESPDDAVPAVERHAAGEPDDAALVQVIAIAAARWTGTFGADVLRVVYVEVEERAVLRHAVLFFEFLFEIDPRGEERLSGEADRARGDRPALAGGRLRCPAVLVVLAAGGNVLQHLVPFTRAEVIGVARLGHRHVGREHGAVR